ncbi:hypothetical protein CsatB_007015 [Cannabis sativa]
MVATIIRGHRLEGYFNGTRAPPPEFRPVAPATNGDTDDVGFYALNKTPF